MRRGLREYGGVGLVYAAGTALLTHPMLGKWSDHLFGDGDSYFVPWILAWVFHWLGHPDSALFDANIFYPAPNSLAFSEYFLSVQLLFAPAYYLSGNPVLAYNLVLLLSFVLSGLTMYAFVRDLTHDAVAAGISGFIFAFAPVRFAHYPHLQILMIWWSPLALLFLERYLRGRSWADFVTFSVVVWLQFFSSFYLGMYLVTMAVVRLLGAAWRDRAVLWSRQAVAKGAFFAAGSLAVLTPVVWPYVEVGRQWRYARSLRENVYASAELSSYLTVFPGNYVYGNLLSRFAYLSWPKPLFLGFLTMALTLLGAWVALRRPAGVPTGLVSAGRAYLAIGVLAFVLSLGPMLIWRGQVTDVPLPYAVFYALVPGYKVMRSPARLGLWVGLTVAVLAGLGCHWLRDRLRSRARRPALDRLVQGGAVGLAAVVVGLESYTPVAPVPVAVNDGIPAIYRFLAREDDRSPLIELPMPKTAGMEVVHWPETTRTYYSIYHRRPMVNGYSGFTPPSFDEIAAVANQGPRPQVIRALTALGVRTLVLHLDEMDEAERQAWQGADLSRLGLREVARFGTDVALKSALELGPEAGLTAAVDLPRAVTAGVQLPVSLLLASASVDRPWVDRTLRRWLDVEVRWSRDATGPSATSRATISLPLFVFQQPPASLAIPVTAPTTGGTYAVVVSSALFSASARVEVAARTTLPGSTEPDRRISLSAEGQSPWPGTSFDGTAARTCGPGPSTRLVGRVFPRLHATLRHDILRIPYTHLILEGSPMTVLAPAHAPSPPGGR
jgi:hypothetical protein